MDTLTLLCVVFIGSLVFWYVLWTFVKFKQLEKEIDILHKHIRNLSFIGGI